MTSEDLKKLYNSHKEFELKNRYIHNAHILPLLEKLKDFFEIKHIGLSVLEEPIHSIKIGTGPKKIFMWSQMHGNESTTTKAVFDICNVFANESSEIIQEILINCTILIIPILNPDGAKNYTRHNANDIDLNRDAKNLSQPESKVLRGLFNSFKPDFCFNLHGQRTIFGVGAINNSATVSFLSPAQDKDCTITDTRKKAMEVISVMNEFLQAQIPNQIGIYDDSFNDNCVGDTFQSLNCPTILFEAGHYKNDYNREITRFYIFEAMLLSLDYISKNNVSGDFYKAYLNIPENSKSFLDIIIRQAKMESNGNINIVDVGVQYAELLKDNVIEFIPKIEKIGDLSHLFAHNNIIADSKEFSLQDDEVIEEGIVVETVFINNIKYSLKLTKA
ncbi:M14 family zinc carboxypeptidase [Formosa maritima]|uniref:Peptidase M14 n=1 Tax=Formosa maritima TaxID=2592046 RepID=A0A5D0GIT0_9FLAO|nr:M14 family zinc carboxypeptidase [Formosa maritima]TYA58925.1 peptidase M14 [Formosa maritima]